MGPREKVRSRTDSCRPALRVAETPKEKIAYDNGSSKANRLYDDSGKYRARAVRPPKNRPSSSRTVFHAPAGPAKSTKMRTASLSSSGGGCTTCTITRSTVPFFEHSPPSVKPRSSAPVYKGETEWGDEPTSAGRSGSLASSGPTMFVSTITRLGSPNLSASAFARASAPASTMRPRPEPLPLPLPLLSAPFTPLTCSTESACTIPLPSAPRPCPSLCPHFAMRRAANV